MVLNTFLSTVLTIFSIAIIAGGALAVFFRTGKIESGKERDSAIAAMQSQIASIKDKQEELEKDNTKLRTIIETIQAALKTRGIMVTIDGDLVSISSHDGNRSTHRKATINKKTTIKKEEQDTTDNE